MKKQKLGPLQKEWIRCLRSGEFKQIKGRLFSERPRNGVYANCCLGVACCVAEANGIELPSDVLVMLEMPLSVSQAMKFRSKSGGVVEHNAYLLGSLAGMNDYDHMRFATIADFVEEDPSRVFTEPA